MIEGKIECSLHAIMVLLCLYLSLEGRLAIPWTVFGLERSCNFQVSL